MSARKQTPEAQAPGDLREEIAVVRELIASVRKKIDPSGLEGLSLKDLLAVLDGISRASERLARMLKSQQALGVDQETMDALNGMMQDLIRQLGR